MDAAHQAGELPYLLRNEALLGSLDLALGDYRAAAERLRPLAARWREMGIRLLELEEHRAPAVEALTAAGQPDEAASLLAELEQDVRNPLAAALIAYCRGQLAAARGDLTAAVAELTGAMQLQDQCSPQPLERGRTLLMLGAVQRRLKQRAAARATLTEAIVIFDGMDASLWAARARAELARVSGRVPATGELTDTERRVTELVSRGMSNREVAAELFVAVRTVEATLTKAYAKLGIRSRAELAARRADLAQRQLPD
jgi:DNA-binding CsgD family transcriptional regulator